MDEKLTIAEWAFNRISELTAFVSDTYATREEGGDPKWEPGYWNRRFNDWYYEKWVDRDKPVDSNQAEEEVKNDSPRID